MGLFAERIWELVAVKGILEDYLGPVNADFTIWRTLSWAEHVAAGENAHRSLNNAGATTMEREVCSAPVGDHGLLHAAEQVLEGELGGQ